jgi:hypothetical protein
MSSWHNRGNYSQKRYFVKNNQITPLNVNINNIETNTTQIETNTKQIIVDDIIKRIKSYGFRFEETNEKHVSNAMGLGDLLWNIIHLQDKLWPSPLYINVVLFFNNNYYPNPENALNFRLSLLNYILENHNTLSKSDIVFFMNNKYIVFNTAFQYDKLKLLRINANLTFPTFNISNYIIFHTKLRLSPTQAKYEYSSIKNKMKLFCESFKSKYTIVILGERNMANSLEAINMGITTIYSEILNLYKNNKNIIDLSEDNIYDNLDLEKFKKDIGIIQGAKYNVHIGLGGQFTFSLLFSNNVVQYFNDLYNNQDSNALVNNPNIKNYKGFSDFDKFALFMNKYIGDSQIQKTNNTINYISGGRLGDFIFQLSVIHANYLKTGKKGILYLADIGDKFVKGLETAYDDTKEFILSQEYIEEYRIYNGEKYDINLSSWRDTVFIKEQNWIELFRNVFNINFGTTKWINNISINSEFQNKIIIGYSLQRDNTHINLTDFLNKYDKSKLHFICLDENEYLSFKNKTGLNIPYTFCKNLMELFISINSCELFIGNFSAPLCVALSQNIKCIGIAPTDTKHTIDLILIKNISLHLPHFSVIY